jgi:hypothetical protein
MRLYFHLIDGQGSLPDLEGVEVVNIGQAHATALAALQELRREDTSKAEEWSGWTVSVADSTGRILFSIDLDSAVR